ncbi:hypothetical protein [Clostridium thermosuccinogenes]|uniref:hypothetical protein n=1 Tax=Clostridium thermosuccinogenes TaxID=84032 RepID=UPI001875569D|nr:hypothetical protein [Pseudoclostridium thermosuccinogenes]
MLQNKHSLPDIIRKAILPVVLSLSVVLLSACGSSGGDTATPERQSTSQQQQSEKIPDQLKSIEENIEKIIKELDGPAVGIKEQKEEGIKEDEGQEMGQKNQEQQGGQEGKEQGGQKEKEQGEQKDKEQSSGQGGSQGEGQGTQQEETMKEEQKQPQAQKDPWQKITPIINDLHYKWNSYMPSAAKKGASNKLIDSFGTSLNSLTNTIIAKNKTNTLMAASMLYANIPDFYSLYRTKTSPEIKRVRYYARNAMLNSMTANWIQANNDMDNLKSSWSLFKNTISKEQQDLASKLDFSIVELEKAIKEKNQPIIDIKGRITLSNVDEMEKAMDEEDGGGSSDGGSESGDSKGEGR